MPSQLSKRVDPLRTSVFAVLARRLDGYVGKRFPFHIGDNWVSPPHAATWDQVEDERFGSPYRYGHPHGEQPLRHAIAAKVRSQNGMSWATADHVQIGVGATHVITCAVQALLDPLDEVLLLAPYWPLVRGICHCSAITPTDVPFFQRLLDDPDADPGELLRPFIGPRTKMIYLISPNNPNGLVLRPAQLQAIADVAREHDLWVLSDEAYEAYAYAHPHVSIATLDGMAERTISVFTFSKSYAIAGTRVGYAVAPVPVIGGLRKVATHSVYNTAQVCQSAAFGALTAGEGFLAAAKETYRGHAALVADELEATFHPAQGGAYVFVDLREFGPDALPVLERAADVGVTLAPGAIFGRGYEGYARFCYTATDRDTLAEGVDRFNAVLRAG